MHAQQPSFTYACHTQHTPTGSMFTSRNPWRRAWRRALSSLYCILALAMLSPPMAQAYTITPSPPPLATKEMQPRTYHALHHRRDALQHVAGVVTGLLFGGAVVVPSARAADSSGGRKGLVNLFRIRAYIVTLKETLQELLDKGEKSAPAEINQQIKYLVRTIRMAESIQEAAVLVEGGDRERDAARSAGRSGYEYLTQVIEFSGFEDMKRDGVSKYATLSSPERIEFALKCLTAADAELGRYFRYFPQAVLADAQGIYESYFMSGG